MLLPSPSLDRSGSSPAASGEGDPPIPTAPPASPAVAGHPRRGSGDAVLRWVLPHPQLELCIWFLAHQRLLASRSQMRRLRAVDVLPSRSQPPLWRGPEGVDALCSSSGSCLADAHAPTPPTLIWCSGSLKDTPACTEEASQGGRRNRGGS